MTVAKFHQIAEVTVPLVFDAKPVNRGWKGTFTYNRVTMSGEVVMVSPGGQRIEVALDFAADWAPTPEPVVGKGSLRGA
jgi:hypothetical protein